MRWIEMLLLMLPLFIGLMIFGGLNGAMAQTRANAIANTIQTTTNNSSIVTPVGANAILGISQTLTQTANMVSTFTGLLVLVALVMVIVMVLGKMFDYGGINEGLGELKITRKSSMMTAISTFNPVVIFELFTIKVYEFKRNHNALFWLIMVAIVLLIGIISFALGHPASNCATSGAVVC